MATELAKTTLQYDFVLAVDGSTLDVDDPAIVSTKWLGKSPFWPNVAGCALSHLEVYRRVLKDGLSHAVVLEDDMNVPADMNDLAEAIASHMTGAEVVLLNYHSQHPCRLSRHGSVSLPGPRALAYPMDVAQLGSTGAYVITAEACRRMVDLVLPVRVPIDDWAYYFSQHGFDRLRCVSAIPVTKHDNFRSTIGYYQPKSPRAYISAWLARANLPVIRNILTFRRQLINRKWSRVEFVPEPSPVEEVAS